MQLWNVATHHCALQKVFLEAACMGEDRLNALLLLFIHKDVALDYDAIIADYAKRNQRRMIFIIPLQ